MCDIQDSEGGVQVIPTFVTT